MFSFNFEDCHSIRDIHKKYNRYELEVRQSTQASIKDAIHIDRDEFSAWKLKQEQNHILCILEKQANDRMKAVRPDLFEATT